MQSIKSKKLKEREDKSGYCLELKMTGCHAITYQPCPECNRSMTTFIQAPNANLKCGVQQCKQLGECVCGQDLIDEMYQQTDADQINF